MNLKAPIFRSLQLEIDPNKLPICPRSLSNLQNRKTFAKYCTLRRNISSDCPKLPGSPHARVRDHWQRCHALIFYRIRARQYSFESPCHPEQSMIYFTSKYFFLASQEARVVRRRRISHFFIFFSYRSPENVGPIKLPVSKR